MMHKSETVFLVSNDSNLTQQVDQILFQEFGLSTISLLKNELAKILFMEGPQFILWDGRTQTEKDENLLYWLREHLHGKPVVAILDKRIDPGNISWYQRGVNMFCYTDCDSLTDTLTFHTKAILEHHAKKQAASATNHVEV
ncbi:hypothetical protein K8I31_13615 [bacterium]|nr:hypothetical protein [bacterium]